MRDTISGAFALALGCIAMYIVYLSLNAPYHSDLPEPSLPSVEMPTPSPVCTEGEQLACTLPSGCEGMKMCFNGQWTDCIVPFVCEPGSTRSCIYKPEGANCGTHGMQTCNECGTGWSECA
ncbi:hypothetical protein DRN67_00590 [Candidatus Micrarchaeota archaeon]|nr:MAG: hypothetical protein DRN67_00590 [Candidatus Micrarchaeota archaeon]